MNNARRATRSGPANETRPALVTSAHIDMDSRLSSTMSSRGEHPTAMHELRQRKPATVDPTSHGHENGDAVAEPPQEHGDKKQVYGKTPDGTGAVVPFP
mgnify:CR=1 FL=1